MSVAQRLHAEGLWGTRVAAGGKEQFWGMDWAQDPASSQPQSLGLGLALRFYCTDAVTKSLLAHPWQK